MLDHLVTDFRSTGGGGAHNFHAVIFEEAHRKFKEDYNLSCEREKFEMNGTMEIQEERLISVDFMDVKGVYSYCETKDNPSSAQEVMYDGDFLAWFGK